MKETFYFSHDYNARNDEKIKRLIRKHWFLWYGIYWALVEDLYQNANELQLDCEGIAYDMRVDVKIISSILQDFELFETNISYFSSRSVWERLQQRLEKSAKAKASAAARWWKKNANAKQTQSEGNAIKESKGKESKIKKSKYWEYKHVFLTLDQYEKLWKDFWEDKRALYIKKLDEWIELKWYKYKNHNLAIRKWSNWDEEKSSAGDKSVKTNKEDFFDWI